MRVAHELNTLYLQHKAFTLIHGACATGADAAASHWYETAGADLGVIEVKFPADWEQFGDEARQIRDKKMIREAGADLVLAFPLFNDRETKHAIELAEAAGIPVKKIHA